MKIRILVVVSIFCLAISCKNKTVDKQKSGDLVQQPPTKIVEAVSFSGKELYQREVDSINIIKFHKRIDSVRAIPNLSALDFEVLGSYYIGLNQFNKAISVYTEGLEKYPNSYRLLRHRGHRYINVRNLDKAISDLKKAESLMNEHTSKDIESYPNGKPKGTYEFWIWYHIGLYNYLNQDFKSAAEAYKKCLASAITSNNTVGATDWLYNTYKKMGNSEKAKALLETIPENFDTDKDYVYFKRLMLHKGIIKPEDLISPDKPVEQWTGREMTYAYSIGNWYRFNGDETTASKFYKNILTTPFWSAWAYVVTDKENAIRTAQE